MSEETNIKISIAILVNPHSGKGKAIDIGNRISQLLAQKKIFFDLFSDQWPSDLTVYTEAWIVGGDGTINYFINNYKDIQIPLVMFRGGTGNDFAWKLYGDMPIEEQVEHVLQAEERSVDVLSCNGKLYINSLGIGFDGEVLSSIGTVRRLGGHLGYLWVVIRKIFSYREPSFTIHAGDHFLKERFLLVVINNNSRTGGGFMVAPEASINDGLADIILCKPLPLLKRFRYLPVIEKGQHLEKPFIIFFQEKEIKVQCEKELLASLDGELIKGNSFHIKVLPDFLTFKF